MFISKFKISAEYTKISIVINPYLKALFHNQYRKTHPGQLQQIPSTSHQAGIFIIQVKSLYLSLVRHLPHSEWLSYHFKIPLPLIRQASSTAGIISVFIKFTETSAGIVSVSKSNEDFHYFHIYSH